MAFSNSISCIIIDFAAYSGNGKHGGYQWKSNTTVRYTSSIKLNKYQLIPLIEIVND
jgi:hypothetical protein